jgi:hypothetical protein
MIEFGCFLLGTWNLGAPIRTKGKQLNDHKDEEFNPFSIIRKKLINKKRCIELSFIL